MSIKQGAVKISELQSFKGKFSLAGKKAIVTGCWVNPKFCVNAKLWCKIERKYFKAGAAQAAAAFSTKITALRGDVKGGGVSLRSSRPLTCRYAVGHSGMRSAKNTVS